MTDEAADAARQARLEAAGFTVVRIEEHLVWHRPAEVAARVRAVLAELRRTRRAA